MTSIMWFRRDLRLRDNPALRAAADNGPVLGLFVIDPSLVAQRRACETRLAGCVPPLAGRVDRRSAVRPPRQAVLGRAPDGRAGGGRTGARDQRLHPYGRARDRAVGGAALPDEVDGVATGTPYAVAPGTITNGSGSPTRCSRRSARPGAATAGTTRRRRHATLRGCRPTTTSGSTRCSTRRCATHLTGCPTPGEDAARRRLRSFLDRDVDEYDDARDDPGADRTSRLSPYLKYGVLHPRQLLADTAGRRSGGAPTFETELAWRDFYADVLFHRPDSAWHDLNPVAGLAYDEPADAIEAWKRGAPASRSSTPGCGSCSARAGCTTGCG